MLRGVKRAAGAAKCSQGGLLVEFCQKRLRAGQRSWWCPAAWRSFRLRRACTSTLSAEVQTLVEALRMQEWVCSLLSEAVGPAFDLYER